jgi:hypothetical protein
VGAIVKVKKWARKARTITVQLEGAHGSDLDGVHKIEFRDARKRTLRTRTVSYRDASPALSAIMTDVQARLRRNALAIDPDSYEFANHGRTLVASVRIFDGGRKHVD